MQLKHFLDLNMIFMKRFRHTAKSLKPAILKSAPAHQRQTMKLLIQW